MAEFKLTCSMKLFEIILSMVNQNTLVEALRARRLGLDPLGLGGRQPGSIPQPTTTCTKSRVSRGQPGRLVIHIASANPQLTTDGFIKRQKTCQEQTNSVRKTKRENFTFGPSTQAAHLCVRWLDIIEWENPCPAPDDSCPPLSVLLCHQDRLTLVKAEIARLVRSVRVDRNIILQKSNSQFIFNPRKLMDEQDKWIMIFQT